MRRDMKKQRTKLLIIIVSVIAAVILVVKLKEPVSALLQTLPPASSAALLLQENDGRNYVPDGGIRCCLRLQVYREISSFCPMPDKDSDFDKYWRETMGDVEPNPDKLNRSCWWYLDPGESITVTMASGLVSDETVSKMLDGTWTLAIHPIPKGSGGRTYTGPGKLG